jgi:PmbA protein
MIEGALKNLSKKADEAEIFRIDSKSSTIKTKKSEIDTFKEKRSLGYGIRVIKNKKMGFYFSNKLDKRGLETVLKVAKVAQEDNYLSIPRKRVHKKTTPPVFEMDVDEGIKMAQELVMAGKDFNDVNPTSGMVSWNVSDIVIANTNGVYGEKSEFTISAYLSAVARGDEAATGFDFQVSREKDLDAFRIGSTACKLAKNSLGAKRLETAKRKVILRPMAVTELLEHTLIPSFSADNVQRGRSKLNGRVSEDVFKGINIIDDATMKQGLMTEDFDDEGVKAQRTVLADKGVLNDFIYDTYTANKEGRESTGNGSRTSYASLPNVGPSNFILSGESGLEEGVGTLVVHGLVGAHTANPISGDFSSETRNAFLNDVPIKKAIVSGNIFDIFSKGVIFGKDPKQYSSVYSPSIELPEIMVIG